MQISELQYNDYSFNKMDNEVYERLKNDIIKNGFLEKDIYHCSDGEIISGNHRVQIARETGKTTDLKLIDLGDLSLDERIRYAEMFNTRGGDDETLRCQVYWSVCKNFMEKVKERHPEWFDGNRDLPETFSKKNRKEGEEYAAFFFGRTPAMMKRYCYAGERLTNEFPWMISKVDNKRITHLHVHYLLRLNKTRRVYRPVAGEESALDKETSERLMYDACSWLEKEYQENGKKVGVDALQAHMRMILIDEFKLKLPDLTDVPWASFWYPEKRIESIHHILEKEVELKTYRRDWKKAMNRLTRRSSFPLSVAFNLFRLLTRKLEDVDGGRNQRFDKWKIVDPFCGMGIRVVMALMMGHEAYGYDIAEPTIKHIEKELWPEFENSFSINDARSLPHDANSVDLVFTSPPYWNVEKYEWALNEEAQASQLSNIKDYQTFLRELCVAFDEMKRIVKVGGYVVLVVANFRDRKGKYYPFVHDVESNILSSDNFSYFDKIILAHDISKPTGGIKSIEKNHTRTAHEEMLIFKKEKGG